MTKFPTVVALAALLSAPLNAQTPAQWREDLRMLSNGLTKVHPAPFHDTAPATFNAAVKSLDANIPKLTNNQIIVRMLGIVAMVKDAHTQLHATPPAPFPVRVYKFADGIFVTGVRAEDSARLGTRIVTINGRPVEAVWDSVQKIAAGDNEFSRMEAVPRFIANPKAMNGLGLGDTTSLRIGTASGEFTVTPGASVTVTENRDTSNFRITRDGDILYAKFNSVQGPFSDFGQRLIAMLDTSTAAKLVIDIRNNPGGNNDLAKPVVSGIARSKFNVRGMLFVITGRRTYSAAMNFTSMLEDQTRAIFVGEAPGGSPHHYGDATLFTLPNSKMNFTVSTLEWTLGVQPMDVRLVMEPDIAAPPRHEDVANGRDGALEAIRAYSPDYPRVGVQNALKSAWSSIAGGTREQIFQKFKAVTDAYPDSHQAWFESARVYAFVRDWKEVARCLRVAHDLRPQHQLTTRLLSAAQLRIIP